jgi:glycoprotein 6-alpha-L-fucosyltransferase
VDGVGKIIIILGETLHIIHFYHKILGCFVHHMAESMILSYYKNITLYFNSTGFLYKDDGFDGFLEPLSKSCNNYFQIENDESRFFNFSTLYGKELKPLRSVPADLNSRLEKLTGSPVSWFHGQIIKFLLKFSPQIQTRISEAMKILNFVNPIVGVQIRRTDKLFWEAEFYSVEKYMSYVEEYFDRLEMTEEVKKRRIYLSTDDPETLEELKRKFPQYEVISGVDLVKKDERFIQFAVRYTFEALVGVVIDTHLLSRSDYLVCTMSSNICRLAFEKMQAMHPDASDKFKSLDFLYFVANEMNQLGKAVVDHNPLNSKEIELKVGDELLISSQINHDGIYRIFNKRTQKSGFAPAFKINNTTPSQTFPDYSSIP